jgi:hypothetical protein
MLNYRTSIWWDSDGRKFIKSIGAFKNFPKLNKKWKSLSNLSKEKIRDVHKQLIEYENPRWHNN